MTDTETAHRIHYIHRMSSVLQKRIVGLFVLLAVLVILGLVIVQIQSSHLLDDKIIYHAYMANAQGISTETQINISGIEVGRVKAIDITDENKIHVTFFVYDSFQRLLRTDSTGELNKLSVIGNTVIIISAGSHHLPLLPAGSTILIAEPVTVDDLLAELTPVITSMKETVENLSSIIAVFKPGQLQSVTNDLTTFMTNMRQVSDQLNSGKGVGGQLLYNKQLEQSVSQTLRQSSIIVNELTAIASDSRKAMSKVDSILDDTRNRVNEIELLLEPARQLLQQSGSILNDIGSTSRIVNQQAGQLPGMISKTRQILDSTNRSLQNAQKVWPLSNIIPADNMDNPLRNQPLDD